MMAFLMKKTTMIIVKATVMMIMMVSSMTRTMMIMMAFLTTKTLMTIMTAFLMTKTIMMTTMKTQAMVLKRALLTLLDFPWPFVLLSSGALSDMSCDKKQPMNLLYIIIFPFHIYIFYFPNI